MTTAVENINLACMCLVAFAVIMMAVVLFNFYLFKKEHKSKIA